MTNSKRITYIYSQAIQILAKRYYSNGKNFISNNWAWHSIEYSQAIKIFVIINEISFQSINVE